MADSNFALSLANSLFGCSEKQNRRKWLEVWRGLDNKTRHADV